jgi:3-oxoacyl-[acyl-carrier protein] reductase
MKSNMPDQVVVPRGACTYPRRRGRAVGVRDEIELAGGRTMQVTADVTRFAELEAMRRQVEGELGAIDILVPSAGGWSR